MKKIGLLIIIVLTFLMLPFSVLADKKTSSSKEVESSEEVDNNEDDEEENKEVKVYFFHGDGCPHCADAEEFFDSIEDKYGDLFEIVAYETWYDSDNAALLKQIGELREETITGVPYILIGNTSWPGYASDYDDEIIEAIKDEYDVDVDERYDIMEFVDIDGSDEKKNDYSDDALILIVILIAVAGVVAGIIFARKKTS